MNVWEALAHVRAGRIGSLWSPLLGAYLDSDPA